MYGFNSIFINFNNPTVGPAFQQLYIRQALQYLINQPLQISKVFSGYAQPDYGMVVNGPAAEEGAEPNAYPYSPAKARALLTAHGWAVHPGGTTTCARPGTAANECGAGIKAGFPLTFNLLIYSGALQQEIAMTSYKTVAATVGIDIKLVNNVNVFAAAPACTPSQSDCSWQLADWGGGVYTPPNGYPIEAGYTDCGGNNNHENYCNPAQDKLDALPPPAVPRRRTTTRGRSSSPSSCPCCGSPMPTSRCLPSRTTWSVPSPPTRRCPCSRKAGTSRSDGHSGTRHHAAPDVPLMGYPSGWSVRAGTPIEFMVSAGVPSYQAEIIRITGRGPRPDGDGPPLSYERVPSEVDGRYAGAAHQTVSGSYGIADEAAPSPSGDGAVSAWVYPTLPVLGRWQSIVTWLRPDGQPGLVLGISEAGQLALRYRRGTEPRARCAARAAGRPPVALRGGERQPG